MKQSGWCVLNASLVGYVPKILLVGGVAGIALSPFGPDLLAASEKLFPGLGMFLWAFLAAMFLYIHYLVRLIDDLVEAVRDPGGQRALKIDEADIRDTHSAFKDVYSNIGLIGTLISLLWTFQHMAEGVKQIAASKAGSMMRIIAEAGLHTAFTTSIVAALCILVSLPIENAVLRQARRIRAARDHDGNGGTGEDNRVASEAAMTAGEPATEREPCAQPSCSI